MDNRVYKDFNEDNIVPPGEMELYKDWPKYRSIDFGYSNPFVCLYLTVDKHDNIIIYDEYYVAHKSINKHAEAIIDPDTYFEYTTCDPSESSGRSMLLENGIPTLAVRTSTMQGIEVVKESLRDNKLLIAANCEETIKEFQQYEYDPETEKPEHRHDHAMAAVRFFIVNWRRYKHWQSAKRKKSF